MKSATQAGQKILVRGVNWLGDAVMSMAAVQRLHEALPQDSITLLTDEKLSELWSAQPAVSQVMGFRKGEGVLSVARRLRAERFDVALIFPNSFRSALEVFLAGIPVRVGYEGNMRGLLLTKAVRRRSGSVKMHKRSDAEIQALIGRGKAEPLTVLSEGHHIFDYQHLAKELGASTKPLSPRIDIPESEIEVFAKKLGLETDHRSPVVGLNPGAEYGPAKRWPTDHFVRAGREIIRQTGAIVLIFGGAADQEITVAIAQGISSGMDKSAGARVIDLAGRTSLRELCAGMALCRVVLTNDTGPMHLAAAVGASVVVVFG